MPASQSESIWFFVAISLVLPVGIGVLALIARLLGQARWKTYVLVAGCVTGGIGSLWAMVLTLSLLAKYPFGVLAGVFVLAAIGWLIFTLHRWKRSGGERRCMKCGYDMSGTESVRCPECGWTAKREELLFMTRRHWRLALLAIVPAIIAAYFVALPKIKRDGWVSLVPTIAIIWTLEYDEDWAFDELHRRAQYKGPVLVGDFQVEGMRNPSNLSAGQWRSIAAHCMSRAGDPDASSASHERYIDWLYEARKALGNDPIKAEINAVFEAHLDDANPQIRSWCARLLVDPNDADGSVARLAPQITDEIERVRFNAAYALRPFIGINDRANELILMALGDPSEVVRYTAMQAVSEARGNGLPDSIVDRIRAMKSDDSQGVQFRYVQVLAAIVPDDEAIEVIEGALASDNKSWREGAVWAISRELDSPHADRLLRVLIDVLNDPDKEMRDLAMFNLREVGVQRLRPFMDELRLVIPQPDTEKFLEQMLTNLSSAEGRPNEN